MLNDFEVSQKWTGLRKVLIDDPKTPQELKPIVVCVFDLLQDLHENVRKLVEQGRVRNDRNY